MRKVLFTTPMLMHPAASGPHLRIENSIKALATLTELHIVSRVPAFAIGKPSAITFYQRYAHTFSFSPSVDGLSPKRYVRRAQILLRKLLVNDAKYLVNYAKEREINIIWFGYGNLSYPLIKEVRALAPDMRLICDTDSVWSRFLFRELPFIEEAAEKAQIMNEVIKKEQEERAWVALCDITTAVSEIDAQYYRNLTPQKEKVAIFSNVLDVEDYQLATSLPLNIKKPAIYLAGSFGKATSAMNRAANWLIHGILPEVRKSIPNIHCYIVGNHSDISFGHIQDPHITVTGRVESVLPYLKHIDVALTPLQFESGTRFKILEAGACKVPMVSTTLGAEGLPVKDKEHILIADDTKTFAEAIVKLIEDKPFAREIANNSFGLVEAQFGLARLKQEAEEIFARIAPIQCQEVVN